MAVRLVEATLANGGAFFFEQDEAPGARPREVSAGDALRQLDFDRALDAIKAAAARVGESLLDIPQPPDSCEISFGVKLSVAVGVVLAKAGSDANFTITMSWAKKP